MMKKVTDSYETLVLVYQTTWRHFPRDNNLQLSSCYTDTVHQILLVQLNENGCVGAEEDHGILSYVAVLRVKITFRRTPSYEFRALLLY
jgi:hypothetical protein